MGPDAQKQQGPGVTRSLLFGMDEKMNGRTRRRCQGRQSGGTGRRCGIPFNKRKRDPLQEFADIIDVDEDHQDHQGDKELVHRLAVQLFVHGAAEGTAQDTAARH